MPSSKKCSKVSFFAYFCLQNAAFSPIFHPFCLLFGHLTVFFIPFAYKTFFYCAKYLFCLVIINKIHKIFINILQNILFYIIMVVPNQLNILRMG